MNDTVPFARERMLAQFAALATAIHILEAAIPSPMPGVKPGLANVVTLIVFMRHGWQAAVWVSVLRVLASGLALGTLLSPTFFLSAGAALGVLAMLGVAQMILPKPHISAIGLSVLAAVTHIVSQLGIAYYLFIPHASLWQLLPVLLGLSLATGLFNGWLTLKTLQQLERTS